MLSTVNNSFSSFIVSKPRNKKSNRVHINTQSDSMKKIVIIVGHICAKFINLKTVGLETGFHGVRQLALK